MRPLKGAPINNLFSVTHYYHLVTENNFVLENVCINIVQCLLLKKIVFLMSSACNEVRNEAPKGVSQCTKNLRKKTGFKQRKTFFLSRICWSSKVDAIRTVTVNTNASQNI